mgnify:CR=1 FL=1
MVQEENKEIYRIETKELFNKDDEQWIITTLSNYLYDIIKETADLIKVRDKIVRNNRINKGKMDDYIEVTKEEFEAYNKFKQERGL